MSLTHDPVLLYIISNSPFILSIYLYVLGTQNFMNPGAPHTLHHSLEKLESMGNTFLKLLLSQLGLY